MGVFDDFIIIDKIKLDKKIEKNNLSFLDDLIKQENIFFEKRSKKSRFSDLFEQIEKEEKKPKREDNKKMMIH